MAVRVLKEECAPWDGWEEILALPSASVKSSSGFDALFVGDLHREPEERQGTLWRIQGEQEGHVLHPADPSIPMYQPCRKPCRGGTQNSPDCAILTAFSLDRLPAFHLPLLRPPNNANRPLQEPVTVTNLGVEGKWCRGPPPRSSVSGAGPASSVGFTQ